MITTLVRSQEEWLPILAKMPKEGPGIRGTNFLTSGQSDWESFKPYVETKPGDCVLDLGCGHGRMAVPLLGTGVRYFGIDILPEMTHWAAQAFMPWSEVQFAPLPIANGMYQPHGVSPEQMHLPFADESMDGVLALSLFTHIERSSAAIHYVKEVRRVLKLGGWFVSTWFTCPPNPSCNNSAERTVLPEYVAHGTLDAEGFDLVSQHGGLSDGWHDQRRLISVKIS